LASYHSVTPGSYALSELTFAEAKWRNPTGYVLPVITNDFDPGYLPAYLRPVTALQVRGDLAAEVIGWVHERATKGGDGFPGIQDPNERRLEQFVQSVQPPLLHKAKGSVSFYAGQFFGLLLSIVIIIAGVKGVEFSLRFVTRSPNLFGLFGILLSCLVIFLGIFFCVKEIRDAVIVFFKGVTNHIAAVVLNFNVSSGIVLVHLQFYGKEPRGYVIAASSSARNAVPGSIGWAYIYRAKLLDFLPVSYGSPKF
jgi:hypothetical protein